MYKRLLVTVLVSVFVFSLWGKTETVCQSLEVEDSVPVFQKDTLPVKGVWTSCESNVSDAMIVES